MMSTDNVCFIGAVAKGNFVLVKVVPSSLKKTMLSPVGIIRLSPNLPRSDLSIYKPCSLATLIKRRLLVYNKKIPAIGSLSYSRDFYFILL